MPLIEAALAFAITMLALSLICSSFIEIIHRTFKMREAGLQYMLRQLFDQVLAKYVEPLVPNDAAAKAKNAIEENDKKATGDTTRLNDADIKALNKTIQDFYDSYKAFREGFVERMTANRAPVGLDPDPTLAAIPNVVAAKPWWWPGLLWCPGFLRGPGNTKPGRQFGNIWGGRHVTALTPTEFMERLGSHEVGHAIRNKASPAQTADVVLKSIVGIDVGAEIGRVIREGKSPEDAAVSVLQDVTQKLGSIDLSQEINRVATTTGKDAADALDNVVKDIAQKFDGFGKDAGKYFEGRARMMSVLVAIALAFLAHVDAVDLFRTYLHDPNARTKVIEQTQAVTAQYKAAKEAADALKQIAPAANTADTGKQPAPTTNVADTGKQPAPGAKTPPDNAASAQIEHLRKDWQAAIGDVNATIKQYADLGVPLGWTTDRINAADMWQLVWTCKNDKGESEGWSWSTLQPKCKDEPEGYKDGPKNTQYKDVWFEVPKSPRIWLYLFLGGLLIGLGSPFWYDAVAGLTNIRNAAGGQKGAAAPPAPAAAPISADATKAQPVTPVGAFRVANDARAIR